MGVPNQKRIAMYTSGRLFNARETGGVKRFKELLAGLTAYCSLTLISGDEDTACPSGVAHIKTNPDARMHGELGLWLKNRKTIRTLNNYGFDNVLVFDVPPMVGLVLSRVKHITLLVRKDLIGYEEILLNDRGANVFARKMILWLFQRLEGLCLQNAERIIVQCEYDKACLLERHPFLRNNLRKKIRVQINNVNPSWITLPATERGQQRKLLENCIFTVGCVSSFSGTRKGCLLFLEAAAKLLTEGQNMRFWIAGDGSLLKECREKYAMYPQIVFVGTVASTADLLEDSDLAVVPSYADSCPNTVLEALNVGTPVIGSNAGGIPEILDNAEALFELNAQALCEKIKQFSSAGQIEKLKLQQAERKRELTFCWVERIYDLLP